jgi:hypothetical protein
MSQRNRIARVALLLLLVRYLFQHEQEKGYRWKPRMLEYDKSNDIFEVLARCRIILTVLT